MVIGSVLAALSGAVANIGTALAGASGVALLKVGVIVGIGIVASKFIMAYLKNKKKIMTNEDSKSPVDRAIQLNYEDAYNREELAPVFDRVKKAANKEQGIRLNKKKIKAIKNRIRRERGYIGNQRVGNPKGKRYFHDTELGLDPQKYYDGWIMEEDDIPLAELWNNFEKYDIPREKERRRNYRTNDHVLVDLWNGVYDIPYGSHDHLMDGDYDGELFEEFGDVDWTRFKCGLKA